MHLRRGVESYCAPCNLEQLKCTDMSESLLSPPLIFAPSAARDLGETIARAAGLSLSPSEEREFENGEHKMRPLVNVRNRDVYVVAQLCGDVRASANDKLLRTLFFIGALKDAGAARITACTPYLPYARKDRRTKANDPITTRYVATMFEAVGADCVAVMDVHNLAAYENAFRIQTLPLDGALLLAEHLRSLSSHEWVVVSPDVGGVKRSQHVRELLESALKRSVGSAFMDKRRSGGVVSGDALVGDVTEKHVLIVDDMISTGTTMLRAVSACRKAGAREVHLAATHAVFTSAAQALFENSPESPDSVVVTNSVRIREEFQCYAGNRLKVLDVAPLYAELILRVRRGEAINDLCGL